MNNDKTTFTPAEVKWLTSIGAKPLKDDDHWCFSIQHHKIRLVVQKIPCTGIPYMATIDDQVTKLEFLDTGRDLKGLITVLLHKYMSDAAYISQAREDADALARLIQ